MLSRRLLIAAFTLAFPAAAFAAPKGRIQPGDVAHGEILFQQHCASCHGADGTGGGYLAQSLTSPAPTNLRRPGFLVARGDEQLYKAIMEGGKAVNAHFTMPAFSRNLGVLDGWDLVAWIRKGQLEVGDFFPDAARFASKDYTLDDSALKRLEDVVRNLTEEEKTVTIVTAFSGDQKPADGPQFVPQDPRLIADLLPKQKLGYIAFVQVPFPGLKTPVELGISMARNGTIQKILARTDGLSAKDRARVEKLISGYEGQGGKRGGDRPKYLPLKPAKAHGRDGAAVAKALTRAYYRGVEGAVMFDREERERHWAD